MKKQPSCATALACRLARFAANAPGVMYSYRRLGPQRGYLPYVSPNILALSGLLPAELASDVAPLLRLIHPDDRGLLDHALEQSARDFAPYRLEFRLHHPETGERWVEMRASPEIGSDGGCLWHGFMVDVTDSKRAADLLRESERELHQARNRLAAVLNTLPDLLWLKDCDGIYLACNPAFERFFGAGEAAIVGKTDYDFVDRELADFFRQKDREAIAAKQICINEETVTYADDGRRGILETRKVPVLDNDGEAVGVLGIGRDISARRQLENELANREREFRTIADNSPDLIVRYDRECRLIYCNRKMSERSGVSIAQLLDAPPFEYSPLPAEVVEDYAAVVRRVIDTAESDQAELNWERHGVLNCIQYHLVPEFSGDGKVCSVLAVGRDISALKQTEDRLLRSHGALRALAMHQKAEQNEERRELAHLIHEDLAQNLSALRMQLSLLEMEIEPAALPLQLKSMRDIADRCIARSRAMVSMLRPTVLDVGIIPALRWLADDFSTGIGIKIDLFLQDDIDLEDETTTFLFCAAREALINTTLHATATRVSLTLQVVADVCHLVVRDNGRGFDPGAPLLSDSFGLLGLTEQAHHLGGELAIDTAPEHGTALAIRVPAKPAAVDRQKPDKNQIGGRRNGAEAGRRPDGDLPAE